MPRRFVSWVVAPLVVAAALFVQVANVAVIELVRASQGTVSEASRGIGQDALWLGHAWVDGRKDQSAVDALAALLHGTGVRDLFVHTGPLADDGTLDPALAPRAAWLTAAIHAALPGLRVQAWLGAHPVPAELHLDDTATRERVGASIAGLLDIGFDGIHYDFEPVTDGDPYLLTMLRESRPIIDRYGAVLSVSAIHLEPWRGPAALVPPGLSMWSAGYLHQVSVLVDQVALMSYDTGMPTAALYRGYVRLSTQLALSVVPASVDLLIGVPAYPASGPLHRGSENITAALRGVRLALAGQPPRPGFGVALYVDFTATADDWAVYRRDW